MLKNAVFFLLAALLLPQAVLGQNCALNLREAENQFNAGRVEEVPGLLEDCLVSGFTKAEELKAYKLIIRSFLFDDKTEMAEATMLEFLTRNPEYQLSTTDNADFVYLFNQFAVKPVAQVGLHGAANMSLVSVGQQNSLSGDPEKGDYRNDAATYGVGIDIRFRINSLLEIGAGVDYSQVGFSYTESFLDFTTVHYSEKQQRLEVPVQLYYNPFHYGIFYPYAQAGLGLALNFNTEAVSYTENIDVNNAVPHTGEPENRNQARQFADPFLTTGIGCKLKLPRSYLVFDLSGRLGTTRQSITELPSNMQYYYYYTDDQFRVNTLRFSIGYIYIFYKPEKQ